ncbi:MAG: response regulator [Chloroflexota bacterium]
MTLERGDSMTLPRILLVDDQRDILRLLHSTLDTLGHEFEIFEAPSGEEALLMATTRKVDLLVSDYKLPGLTGVELLAKMRSRNPDMKSILITAATDRKARDEMRNAGAIATFDKPIPLADFLDVVERSLGLKRTISPPEDEKLDTGTKSLSGLMAGLRKKIDAQAVFLLSDRGRVMERAGDLYDNNMEVSLFSAIMAIFSAGHKVSRIMRMDDLSHYHVFTGENHDLIVIPVSSLYALVVGGARLAERERIIPIVEAMLGVRNDIERSLRSIGVPTAPAEQEAPGPVSATLNVPTQDIASLFAQQAASKMVANMDADAFWDEAVEKHGNPPLKADHLSYEQAKQLGLAPSKGSTKPLDQAKK